MLLKCRICLIYFSLVLNMDNFVACSIAPRNTLTYSTIPITSFAYSLHSTSHPPLACHLCMYVCMCSFLFLLGLIFPPLSLPNSDS